MSDIRPDPDPKLVAVIRKHNHDGNYNDVWRCQCGFNLPFYGHSYDRWAEHLALMIEQIKKE